MSQSAQGASRTLHLSQQVVGIAVLLLGLLLVALLGFGMWAAQRIDAFSLDRQALFIQHGVTEIADRTRVEQDSAAIWDDSVVNLRSNNGSWLADNLAEWMSSYYGHDRLYLLDPLDHPLRSVSDGQLAANDLYTADQPAIAPLVAKLRQQMADASAGLADSTAAITGLGTADRVDFADGSAGLVSVRPVVPGSDAVPQAPGTEFLLVSVKLFDADFAVEVGRKYNLDSLHFERAASGDKAAASTPLLDNAGRIVGFFAWSPYQPAGQLIRDTGPAGIAFILAVAGLLLLLLRRLRKTSTELELSEAQAKYLAFHDALAQIPNRALFEDRLERALTAQRRTGLAVALHAIDLDRFKNVNDTLGHPAGDELIRQVAARLSALISDVDTVARIGGDEFAIVQVDARTTEQVLALSARVIAELERPFDLDGHEALISASLGVVFSDVPGADPQNLMRHADVALYDAKLSGRGRYQLYAGDLDDAVRERRTLERHLRAALNGEPGLDIAYQPIFDAASGRIAGAEALVRWNHPERGPLSPQNFIGLAEERGLIDQLGAWVLREACRYGVRSRIGWVAVNVSPVQFRDDRFADHVLAILAETGLEPHRLELEITEGLLLQNSPAVQATLRKLRANGIRVALDDFGTGYSSISYLRAHGVDKLKIDQSFVAQLGKDLEIDNIVDCIVGLARAMHMKVTAEGVETLEQQARLRSIGCNELQGYLLARPVSAAKLDELVAGEAPPTQAGAAA